MMEHGWGAYAHGKCRCDVCKEANRQACIAARAKRKAGLPESAEGRHGKYTTYTNYGCRCEECTAVHSAHCLARRRKQATA